MPGTSDANQKCISICICMGGAFDPGRCCIWLVSMATVITISSASKPLIFWCWPVFLISASTLGAAAPALAARSLNGRTVYVFCVLLTVVMVCASRSMMVTVVPVSV